MAELVVVPVAVVVVLVWLVAAAVMLPRCSMLTGVTLLQTLHNTLSALDLPVDVLAVDVVMVELVVDSTVAHRLFWVVDSEHSVCKVDPMVVRDVPIPVIPV